MALGGLVFLLAAQIAAQQYAPAPFRNFSGGINDNAPAIELPPEQSPDALNVVIDEPPGALLPRNGFTQCGTLPSGNTPKAAYEYARSDGTRKLIVSDLQNYYQTADCITFTTIITGLSSTAQPTFATVRDKLWVANKSTHVFTWDGANATLLDARAGTPNPKPGICAYLELWRDRVWCARLLADAEGVEFSALTDANGNTVDPSTGSLAWPAANVIYVNRSGGPLYAIKAYHDGLYAFKDREIWKISFENEFNIRVDKTLSQVGTRFQQSIVEQDNLLYFIGPDGIYAFDGEQSVRISDDILNKFNSLRQPLVNQVFKTWTTASDFANGTLYQCTTSYVNGSVVPTMLIFDDFNDGDYTTAPAWSVDSGTTGWAVSGSSLSYAASSPAGSISSTNTVSSGIWSINMQLGRASNDYVEFKIMSNAPRTADTTNGYSIIVCANVTGICPGPTGLAFTRIDPAGHVILASEGAAPDTNNHEYRIHKNGAAWSVYRDNALILTANDGTYATSVANGLYATNGDSTKKHIFDNIRIGISSYSVFTSDIFNAVTVSTWSTFDADVTLNGNAINFQVRVGSNTGAVQSTAWSNINSGDIISGTTNQTSIQWRALISASTSSVDFPAVNAVVANYLQGGDQAQTIFSQSWKNRLWIAASSGTASTNNIMIVKSRYPLKSWMFYDLQVGPLVRFNDLLYAGASTHSAIYRLDYGTNDNGAAINSYWQTRDETWQLPYNAKNLQEIDLDFERKNTGNLQIGWSRDSGATFTNKTVSTSGSGRATKRLLVNGGNSPTFRFRIGDSTLDETYKIYGLNGLAIPYMIRDN